MTITAIDFEENWPKVNCIHVPKEVERIVLESFDQIFTAEADTLKIVSFYQT